jgi:hypothetical protein
MPRRPTADHGPAGTAGTAFPSPSLVKQRRVVVRHAKRPLRLAPRAAPRGTQDAPPGTRRRWGVSYRSRFQGTEARYGEPPPPSDPAPLTASSCRYAGSLTLFCSSRVMDSALRRSRSPSRTMRPRRSVPAIADVTGRTTPPSPPVGALQLAASWLVPDRRVPSNRGVACKVMRSGALLLSIVRRSSVDRRSIVAVRPARDVRAGSASRKQKSRRRCSPDATCASGLAGAHARAWCIGT